MKIPDWIAAARKKWKYTGESRPPFAEIPRKGEYSVWDFTRPPGILMLDQRVRVLDKEVLIGDTMHAISIRETASPPTVYLPPESVDFEGLVKQDKESWCEWKGKATYWAKEDNPSVSIAWSYENPFDEYLVLKDFMAFYPHIVDCYIGAMKVAPQESSFYGGWVTPDIIGPFKGAPGTEDW